MCHCVFLPSLWKMWGYSVKGCPARKALCPGLFLPLGTAYCGPCPSQDCLLDHFYLQLFLVSEVVTTGVIHTLAYFISLW